MNVLKGCRFTVVSCIAVNGVTVIENPQPKADQDQAVGEFVLNQHVTCWNAPFEFSVLAFSPSSVC